MYQYNLNISIFSQDDKLEKIIREIEPQEKFTHEIRTYDIADVHAIANSDVLVWDFPVFSFARLKQRCKSDAKIIVCSDGYIEEYEKADGVLLKSFKDDFNKFYIKKILEKIKLEEDKRYKETLLDVALNSTPDMAWVKDINGIHTLVNDSFCEIVGKTKEDVTGRDHFYIWNVSPDDPNSGADGCKETEDKVIAAGHTLSFPESVKGPKGPELLVTYKSPIPDKNGNIIGTFGFAHNITDLTNLSIENEALFNIIPFAVLLRDMNGIIKNVNIYFEDYFEVLKDQVVGTPYEDWEQKTFLPGRKENTNGFLEGTTYSISGEMKKFELRVSPYQKNVELCAFRDVTQDRENEEKLRDAAYKDSMTALYNRRYLYQFISEQSEGMLLNLFAIDLDHFKSINDTYGHEAGDEAIILTANTLKEYFSEDTVIRTGGDEFLVVKTGDYSMSDLKKQAKVLLDTLAERFGSDYKFKELSASVGITQGILDGNIDELINHSDQALYDAKNSGRNCYCVYDANGKVKKIGK